MLRLITAFTMCMLCLFTTAQANNNEVFPVFDASEILSTAESMTNSVMFATITIMGRKKVQDDGSIRCPGRKVVCVSGKEAGEPTDSVFAITTYNEDGAPDDFFLVSSFEIVEGEENGEPVTYFYFELYEE